MNKQEIFDKVAADFKEVFQDNMPLSLQTALVNVKTWDSMGQVIFLSKLEKTFSVKFKMKDIVAFRSIENIVDGVEKLLQ